MLNELKNIKLFLIDFDGTTYVDTKLIDGATDFLKDVEKQNKKFCFITNNSSVSVDYYVKKLHKLGIVVDKSKVYSSSTATINFLKQKYSNKKIFLLGTKLLKKEFVQNGIRVVDTNPDVVVVAYDTELTYKKLDLACLYIRKGLPYIATHPDNNCPKLYGFAPDVGSFISLIKTSTNREPDEIIGKPNKIMAKEILSQFKVKKSEVAMIGDRLVTDIAFANNNGMTSIAVLTGETTREILKKSNIKPNITVNSIKDLI